MQDNTVLYTNRASLLRPRYQAPTSMALRIPLATPIPSPTLRLLAALLFLVQSLRLQELLAPPLFKDSARRC